MKSRAHINFLAVSQKSETRGSSPTVKEGSDSLLKTDEPSFTVGLLPRALLATFEAKPLFIAVALLSAVTSVSQGKPKWHVLFDGKSTAEWRGFRRDTFPAKCWQVEKGQIKTVGGCDKSDQVDIVTRKKYRNFELEFEWRVAPGANSGIIYLISEDQDQTWKTGPEMQVLDDDKHPDGKKPSTSAGSLFDLIAPGNKTLRPVGEYNKSRLVINNGHVEHWLNGTKVLEYDLGSATFKELIAKSKFKGFPRFALNSEGFIALQYHGDDVWYRKIRIRTF